MTRLTHHWLGRDRGSSTPQIELHIRLYSSRDLKNFMLLIGLLNIYYLFHISSPSVTFNDAGVSSLVSARLFARISGRKEIH